MKRVALLGSTGSIGCNTLDVIASYPDRLQVVGLAGRSRIDKLAQQVQRFRPRCVAVWDADKAQACSQATGYRNVAVGLEGLIQVATDPEADIVVVATSGRDALIPLVRAIQAGKRIALASKELLVMAGELLMRLVREHGASLVPIDSEHAALFQCLQGVDRAHVARLVITGSGGPLWRFSPAQRSTVTRKAVLAHPKWQMGRKITVDSATLMNKGLELIEAHWLFDRPLDQLQVLIHPQAVIHGFVELIDGTTLAQLSPCDMRLPIQYALSFPDRWPTTLPRSALTQQEPLQFEAPDPDGFPCLRLALDAAAAGGSACVALNGANDVAVQAYLDEQIRFSDIPRVVAETLEQHHPVEQPTLDDILAVDTWSRTTTQERIHACSLRSYPSSSWGC